MNGFNISLSGLMAGQTSLNTRANNIANVRTPGFRASRADLSTVRGGGVGVSGISPNLTQGPLQIESGPFSAAVLGDGLFQVEGPGGRFYSRAGVFSPDREGILRTPEGYRIDPEVRIPADATGFAIGSDGTVTARMAGGNEQVVGKLEVVRFRNPAGLQAEGGNRLSATPASGPPQVVEPGVAGGPVLAFGMSEGSNVDLTSEMVGQIIDENLFKVNLSALKAQDEMLGEILDLEA